jgi:hypothetical protein
MTPKLICENYRCKIGSAGEARVFGMTEYTGRERSAPGQYVAVVRMSGKSPEKYETDSFENAVAIVARVFGEPEDAVRKALENSIPASKRMSTASLFAERQPTGLKALTRQIGKLWSKSAKKLFDLS